MLPTEFIKKNKSTGQGSQTGATARSSARRMTSDDRFKAFMDARLAAPAQRRWGGEFDDFAGSYSRQPMRRTLYEQRPEVSLPLVRKEWNTSLDRKPSAANPFGEALGKTDPRHDAPMPAISPEIREMAKPDAAFVDMSVVTPDYIKSIARQDNDLARRLAKNYMDEYSRRMIGGYVTEPLDDQTVNELSDLSGRNLVKPVESIVGGLFKLIDTATRAPVKAGAYQTLAVGFENQPKTIDPTKIKTADAASVSVANIDIGKLPWYYRRQLDINQSPLEEVIYPSDPGKPDANPEKHAAYQTITDNILKQRQDWDYYTDFATAADGVNTLFSAPGIRVAQAKGESAKLHQQNILGTGNIAGLTSFERVIEFVKAVKDAGVMIDPEDRASLRNGWSAETINKYAQKLVENGRSLSDIILSQGMTWPELKRALNLARFPAENQADIARSLGFKIKDAGEKPIFVTRYSSSGENRMVSQVQEEIGKEFQFSVDNPDMVVSLDDIKTKADAGWVSGEQLAQVIGMKYTYAYLADVKTVPFQDLAASIAFDPTNYGKLQLIWEPVGLLFKGGAKAAKLGGKALIYGTSAVGDVAVGSLKSIGNLIGKARGLESQVFKPEQWHEVTNAAKYLMSETTQSVTNKMANRAFFVTKSIISPEYLKDGDGALRWVDQVLPKLQESAKTGDWSAFMGQQVPVASGNYVAQGLNAISNDLTRIAKDEDAFGRFADSVLKPFSDPVKGVDVDDVKHLRALVENGDYAGVTRLIADKTVASRVTGKFGIEEARKSLDISDIVNHSTSAYKNGIHVLTQKSMGTWDKELISPKAAQINDFLSGVSRQWTNAVLTARPGWNVINWIDNNARLIANGYNPSANVADYERTLSNLGVTPTQMREIIYGGNFMDEAVRLNVPVTQEVVDAVEVAKRITVDSDAKDIANLVEHASRAADSVKEIPAEARKQVEEAVGHLRAEVDKLAKGKGDVKSVREAAAKVDNLPNQMFGKSATVDTKLFKSRLDTLREYGNILKSGDGNAIARIWNNWVEMGHAVHRDIEAAARMRVFAPTYIDNYHKALESISRDLPQFPDEAQLAERFAHIVDPQQRAEVVRETLDAYQNVNQRLNGLINEAALKPNELPNIQAYLENLRTDPRSMARNFIYSTQPVVNGMTPAADVLMQNIGDWMSGVFDGTSTSDRRDPARVKELIDAAYNRATTRLKVEGAEANLMVRIDEVIKPSTRVPDSAANWLQDSQVTNPRDIAVTVKRMTKIRNDIEAINQEMYDSFLELNHEPYLNALDLAHRQLPDRAHRYDLLRDSFAEKFSGEARYGNETVSVVNGTLDKERGVVAVLSDGRVVPADAVQFDDATRGWYFQQYSKWEKAKPGGNSVLTRSGIGDVTGTGAKMRKPVYTKTGEAGMVPPDVARAYTRKMEDDVVAKGGSLPTEYVDADGVKHALAYDKPEDFVQRFASGSGLGFYKKGEGDLMQGVQRIADNWTHLAKLADANEVDDLAEVLINGRRISELYPEGSDINAIKHRLLAEKSAKVQVRYERNGTKYVLTNDPARGETLTDVTRRMWRDKIEGVYVETRGQWVPVFDPNAAAGSRVTFQKLGRDDALESLRIPVETGTAIPDEVGEQLLKIQEAAEPVEQIGIEVEGALHNLDNLLRATPEPPPFKPDFTLDGADVMAGPMKRLPEGGYGVEVRFADGRTQTARVSELQPKPVEGALNANVAGTPEQIAAKRGVKTAEQQATIEALDPAAEFMKRHPVIQSRDDLLGRGELLRQQGVPVTDQQLNDMADILEAVSQNRFKQEPDFLLKRLNLTAIAPTEGVYQRINLDTPEFKKFFEGSKVTLGSSESKAARTGDFASRSLGDKPLVMYHGSPSAGFEAFDLSKAKSDGLYGPGVYLTDDPKTASGLFDDAGRMNYKGYATSEDRWVNKPISQDVADGLVSKITKNYSPLESGEFGTLMSAMGIEQPELDKIIGSIKPGALPEDIFKVVNDSDIFNGVKQNILGDISAKLEKENVTGGAYPLYVSIKNPFDIDKRYTYKELGELVDKIGEKRPDVADRLREYWRPDNFIPEARYEKDIPGDSVYKDILEHLSEHTFSDENTKAEVNELLKHAGFDGITHVGGSITGNEPHRVFIAFEPGQVKSAIANRGSWDVTNPSMLFQRAEEPMKMTRQGWLTDEERQVVYDQAIAEGKEPAEAMAKAAEGYPASSGMVGAHGEPLFQAEGGEVLGAYKSLFGPNGLTGMIHLGPGATTETIGHELNHFIMAMAEMPEQVFKGPEFDVLRKELRADFNVIAEAAGAPVLKYGGRGPKATRQVMYENLWKVDRQASNLEDPVKWEAFQAEARAASERSAKMWTTYLETGQAPTKKLQGVFDRFKSWLAGVFQVKQRNGDQIPIEVKRVFDRWLAENPEWKLTRKGKYVLGNTENKAYLAKAMELTKKTDDWSKAIDNLMVAYGEGFSDSGAVEAFHSKAKQLIRSMKEYNTSGAADVADDFLETEAGNSLVGAVDNIHNSLETIADIESGVWAPRAKKPSLEEVTLALELGEKVAKPKKVAATEFQKLSAKSDAEQLISDALAEARQYGVELPEDVDPRDALKIIESHIDDQVKKFNASGSGADKLKREVDEFWQAYGEMLQDGKFHPKQFVDGKWVYPEGAGPLTVEGKLHAGQFRPPTTDKVGYLAQEGATIDDLLAKEKGAPASLDELAALNAPGSTYVSPALVEIMKYHSGVKAYLDQWREAMLKAVDGGFTPGSAVRGVDPADLDIMQKWLNDRYGELGRASSKAQKLAEDKTRLVMMDFETTYNMDRLMQQGPALPQWTGQLAGMRPLRVGGIVPFFKFPRENIESWINTLGNHPAVVHNIGRYQEEANIERKRFNLPEQFLPTWPIKVGDKVVSVSPFAFISVGQLIRPFSPYVNEDATGMDQVIGVAGQMGFSLGPTLRLALTTLGLSEESQPIVPQGQALIPPSVYRNIPDNIKGLLGLINKQDEFYVNRQIVFDALADMSNVSSEEAKQRILADMQAAIQPVSGANNPRRLAAADHYYTMKFETASTGYFTGVYPREISPGELDLRQYKTDLAQLRSAMASAGFSPDQVDRVEGYIAGDPRAEANRRLRALYDADPSKAISGTETEAWANSNEVAGKRKEYYDQRAMIEADFQQKYGFSGTTLTDADREEYNKQIQALNKKYEDVLAPKKTAREPWMTDEDYQRDLSSTWLEYLNGTRPQFNKYKTYAEYGRAVDKWEKDLPKISKNLWQAIQSPLAELSTRNISELPGYLDAVSNKAAMDKFRSKYDTVNEAIYSTLRDKYYNGYWDSVNGKVGPERLLSDMEYKLKHPVPNEAALQKWIAEGLYTGRFSQQDIARELKAHPVADIENSILSGKTLPERQAYEISNLLSLIPPGNAYFNFIESLPKDQQKYLSAYQVDSYTAFHSPDKWRSFYDAIAPRLKSEFSQPSLNTVREWVNAVHENEQMRGQRDQRFPGIKSSLDAYNAIDRTDAVARKQYRQQHPEIGRYYDWLYNEWQTSHPLWQKYYGSEETSKSTSVGSGGYSKSTSYGGYGGKRYYAGGGGGKRRSYSSYTTTNASGVSSALAGQWQGFRDMAGSALYNALTNHWDNGVQFNESESALLQSLFKQYPFGAKDYNDWLENILPKLRSAMIPGESIFSRNKRYDNQQNQPQTKFGYTWFGRGKNAG